MFNNIITQNNKKIIKNITILTIITISVFVSFYVINFSDNDNSQYFIIQEGTLKVETTIDANTAIIYNNDLQEMRNIEEVLGHLRIAEEHIHNNNSQLAIAHISHAINELQNKQHATKIPQDYLEHLEMLLHIIKSPINYSHDDFIKNIHLVMDIINEIKVDTIGNKLINDQIFQIQTAIYLLELSKTEYIIGTRAGNLFENNIEIQDSYAFTIQAKNILKNSVGDKFDVKLEEQIKIIQDVKSLNEFNYSLDSILKELYFMMT